MMMILILLPCNILTILILHFSMLAVSKPAGYMVMGVYLPLEHIGDSEVLAITSRFKLRLKALFWVSLLSQALLFFTGGYPSLAVCFTIFFVFGIIGVYSFFFGVYSEKVLKLKKENGYQVGTPSLISLDTEVTRLQNTFPVSAGWFIPGVIIICIVSFCMSAFDAERSFATTGPIMLVICTIYFGGILLHRLFKGLKNVVYSEDTAVNLAINKTYKRYWSSFCLVLSYLSLCYIPCLFAKNFISSVLIATLFSSIIPILYMLYTHKKITDLTNSLVNLEKESFYVDDDEYWRFGFYNNPHSNKVWVPKRVGMGLTINFATPWGKVFSAFTVGIIIWTIVLCISLIPLDFGKVTMTQENGVFKIDSPMYDTAIYPENIKSISTIDTFPNCYRTNGSNGKKLWLGNYHVDGYGTARLNVMIETPLYIVLQLENDTFVFLNGEDIPTTQDYYNRIKLSI